MPELPEVETTKRLLEPYILNKTIQKIQINRPNLRFDFPKILLTEFNQTKVMKLRRHGKYMLWDCDNDYSLIIHLGMTGRFLIANNKTIFPDFYHDYKITEKHEHCIFHFDDATRISYYDPRRFGFFDCSKTSQLKHNQFIKVLGIDGLDIIGHEQEFFEKIKNKKSPIKNILLDQSIIAGVGNIYASEALWRSKIHPQTTGSSLKLSQIIDLSKHIHAILLEAIIGGGSTLRDYRNPQGETGEYQNAFNVYDCVGKICPDDICNGMIQKIVQSNRASFYCDKCQK